MKIKAITSIICITAIIITALILGYDGVIVASGCSVLAGLGGFFAGKAIKS